MNTVYQNFIIENKLKDILETKLNTRQLMTVDESLTETQGMIKKINTYTYTGAVEKVTKGNANTTRGAVTFTTTPYEVEVSQQVFDYFDEEFMADNMVVDAGLKGSASLMVNDMNAKYFAELDKATLRQEFVGTITYDAVVDGIALMNLEDESGLFLIIGTDLKADIRKDADFKGARQGEIVFNGQIGSICGVPVVVSKKTPSGEARLCTKEAVTLFTKKDNEVEQVRDAETRKNTIVTRKVNIVALTDATKVVKLVPKA